MSLIVPVALPHLDGRRLRVASDLDSGCLVRVLNEFNACLHGPSINVPAECAVADLNGDGLVDLKDFSTLQNTFSK